MNKIRRRLSIIALTICAFAHAVSAQTTTFTYQGRLTDASAQANGTYDLGFALFDAASGGNQIGAAQTRAAVTVSNGIFTVQLDFGAAAFPGANRFLEIAVKKSSDANFTTLAPRQQITSTPYAIRAVSAGAADTAANASNLGGTAANQFVQTVDSRLSDSRTPSAGSNNYVQNQNAAAQTSANFRIDGSGEANIFNATAQFNIGGRRVLFTDGDTGANTFVGLNAGRVNSGSLNFFSGYLAGNSNTAGNSNSFVGAQAGQSSTTGNFNAFFGRFAGNRNTTGESNSFLGAEAGLNTTSGSNNSFVGEQAGYSNATGGNNSALGAFANFNANNLNFATAVGSFARVAANDTIVIGKTAGTYFNIARPADSVQIPGGLTVAGTINGTVTNATTAVNSTQLGGVAASNFVQTDSTAFIRNQTTQQTSSNFNVSGNGTAGGTLSASVVNAATQFNFGGSRVLGVPNSTSVTLGLNAGNALGGGNADNTFVGSGAGVRCKTAVNIGDCVGNAFFGKNAGDIFVAGSGNTFIGNDTNSASIIQGATNGPIRGSNNTLLGVKASLYSDDLDHATSIGADSFVLSSNTIALGRISGADTVKVYGQLNVSNLSLTSVPQGGSIHLCLENQTTFRVLACSSSLRFKTNVAPLALGLNTIKQLKPITFDWKSDGHHDFGFGAEDVAKVDPLLAEYDRDGVVSGVRYDRFGALFVNAFKEQQTQIERQQKQIDELKNIVCAIKPDAQVCQAENK